MGRISLEGMHFFAYHGVHEAEQAIGNKYQVDLHIDCNMDIASQTDNIDTTINYAELYEIVAVVMKENTKLLEKIAHKIITKVKMQFPEIESITISVSKFNPPLGGICEKSKVTLTA